MPTVVERMRGYGVPLRQIRVLKSHRVRHYEEDEIVLLLDALDETVKKLNPLKTQVEQFTKRSEEYLEIYRIQLKELEWFRSKYPNTYPEEA